MIELANAIYAVGALNIGLVAYISVQLLRNHTRSNAIFTPQPADQSVTFQPGNQEMSEIGFVRAEFENKLTRANNLVFINRSQPAFAPVLSLAAANDRLCAER
jgi:hypothetical protein